jgi:hypothetical protein
VNAALLVVSSALSAGGDVIPAGWGERAAPLVAQAGGCDPCASAGRGKLHDRLRSKFGSHGPACCDPCANNPGPPNLLDTIRARMAKGCCPPASDCGPVPAGPAAAPVTPPKELPGNPKGSATSSGPPSGAASPAPLAPTTPVPQGSGAEPRKKSPY